MIWCTNPHPSRDKEAHQTEDKRKVSSFDKNSIEDREPEWRQQNPAKSLYLEIWCRRSFDEYGFGKYLILNFYRLQRIHSRIPIFKYNF